MGNDPYHWASGSDCYHLCCGRNYFHCHTARQIKVGGVTHSVYMVTVLGRSRWVGSHRVYTWSQCSAVQSGWGHTECVHGHTVRQIKVGGITEYKRFYKCKVQILGKCLTTRMCSLVPRPSHCHATLGVHLKYRGGIPSPGM